MKYLNFLVALLLTTSSCNNGDDTLISSEENLSGRWFREVSGEGEILRSTHTYRIDGTYEILNIYLNSDRTDTLGYSYLEQGDFSIESDTLVSTQANIYTGQPKQYVDDLGDLELEGTIEFQESTILIKGQKLTEYPICGPLENCVEKVVYTRLED